jgi:hypothetical protein
MADTTQADEPEETFEPYNPQHPLPEEIRKMTRDDTVCQYCGVSYLIHNEIKRIEGKLLVRISIQFANCIFFFFNLYIPQIFPAFTLLTALQVYPHVQRPVLPWMELGSLLQWCTTLPIFAPV